MKKAITACVLLLKFLWALVNSGVQTLGIIIKAGLKLGPAPVPGFVRMKFKPMDEKGATIMGCMITLTPGTTTVDIDMDNYEMLLHLLDTSDIDGAIAGIQKDFEESLLVLYGREQ